MSVITAVPLTARPITAKPLTAMALGVSTDGGVDPLVWHAATYDPTTFELQAQRVGTGTPTFTSSAMLLPDHEGVYVSVSANTAPWHGARWSGGVPYADNGSGVLLNPVPSLYGAPSYTNSMLRSNDIANAYWTKSNASPTLTANGLTGTSNTGTILADNNAGGTGGVASYRTVNITSGQNNVFRVFARSRGLSWIRLRMGGTDTNPNCMFDLANGVLGNDPTGASSIAHIGGGVYECMMPVSSTTALGAIWIIDLADANNDVTVDLDGTSSVDILNAEIHLNKTLAMVRGSAPIVTAASTVTTALVNISYDAANHDNDHGMYFIEYATLGAGSGNIISGLLADPSSGGRGLYKDGTTRYRLKDDGSIDVLATTSTMTAGTFYAGGTAWSLAEGLACAAVNGVISADDTTYTTWRGMTVIQISYPSASFYGVSLIRNIRRYDLPYTAAKEKLTELMA